MRRLGLVCAVAACASPAFGQLMSGGVPANDRNGRFAGELVSLSKVQRLHVTSLGRIIEAPGLDADPEWHDTSLRACSVVSTHTDFDFGAGGAAILQLGMGEGEAFAATYTADPSEFPIKFEAAECVFAVNSTTVQTTTEWSLLIYEGTPDSGSLIAVFSSDGLTLPHVILPPSPSGTQGLVLRLEVDPGDPEQVFISNDGSASFTIAFRIDRHNNQTQNPCFFEPPQSSNAFLATDVSGLSKPQLNWLLGLDCGILGCPPNGGWESFGNLLAGLCRPTGDWIGRAQWSSTNCVPGVGACCYSDGSCDDGVLQGDCTALGGTFQGDGSTCALVTCNAAAVPCCFPSTGNCLDVLTAADCVNAGGVVSGAPGQACGAIICFPEGACCLPDGSCADGLSPEDCAALSGAFQGDGTTCATSSCPQPIGACCFDTGFCVQLTEANCLNAGATWMGFGTDCTDSDMNGTADACEAAGCSPADVTTTGAGSGDPGYGVPDGQVTAADIQYYVNLYVAADLAADLTTTGAGSGDPGYGVPDGAVTAADIQFYVNLYVAGCP